MNNLELKYQFSLKTILLPLNLGLLESRFVANVEWREKPDIGHTSLAGESR